MMLWLNFYYGADQWNEIPVSTYAWEWHVILIPIWFQNYKFLWFWFVLQCLYGWFQFWFHGLPKSMIQIPIPVASDSHSSVSQKTWFWFKHHVITIPIPTNQTLIPIPVSLQLWWWYGSTVWCNLSINDSIFVPETDYSLSQFVLPWPS